ncbi:MAG: ABC transporter, ATP-binding/permease protein [Candidatus Roizmanbacteria bacterium GW2011_GWA2_35_19]|uniref:ABC transporter, ATP-binding/permease protein n=2 Tax=Candidatus Roizmaniibacteriota TaxID=1752723 RepID=A0A0G0C6G6_9BACT|nr:MAG: ABC transporter, ATP-binding/permease protein [Candidatus Roizmanbacteria bacterium GW2011_GWC2_35_12]KKP71716.1 MAG: ABC transporter, ATP-binding/permease protein [Candidatus Roizmanbacteria bacterium GW2011_GWA2_35_19]
MKKTLKYCWKILQLSWRANRYYSILSIIGTIYQSTIHPFILMLVLSKILDLLGKQKVLIFTDLTGLIAIFILSSIFFSIITSFLETQSVFLDTRMDNYLDQQIIKKLTQLDPATFESSEFQNLLAQMEGVKGTITVNVMRITAFIDSAFKFFTAAVIVSVAFPLFIPIMLIATIPSFFSLDQYRQKVWKYFVEEKSILVRVSQYIKNLLSQDGTSKEVVIYKTGGVLFNKVKSQQKLYTQKFTKASESELPSVIITRLIELTAFLFTQMLNLKAVISGSLGIGQFALYFQQTQNLMLGSHGMLDHYSSINMRNKYIEKYFEFMAKDKIIHSPVEPITIPNEPTPTCIEFKNISFRYPNTKRYILKNFNLTIASGEKIALVGENGAGKTTLIKLLLRFYDPIEGEILINGVNIKNINLEKWHKEIGALFQDFIKYQFTFKENVYFGNQKQIDNITLLKEAIKNSGADQYLKDLPNSYDQTVGKMFKEGVDLSGGQWQKLALARAFFKNAPILILDEPTSAIDAKAEYEIFQHVQELQKDKTVFIISHRFSTVRNADRILVLDEGRIIEEGNHEALIKKKGLYEELFNIQAKGYK